MTHALRPWILAACLPLSMMAAAPASAGDGKAEVPMRDPWLPPAAREAVSAPVTRGAALHGQVENKIRQSFDAADVEHAGSITLAQAKAANLGVVANNFDRIDTRKTGRVSFEDLKRFLKGRGASTL